MLNHSVSFLLIINITALNFFGLACIIIICLGVPAELIADALKKPKKLKKGEKRPLAIDKVYRWDYLIIILPVWLLLIVFFGDIYSERTFSMVILGLGYSGLILTSYNRRIDVPQIRFFIVTVCLLLLASAVIINYNVIELSKAADVKLLYAPAIAYVYFIFIRSVIKFSTGTYPITLDKYYRVGQFNQRYNRLANWWDMTWSVLNMILWIVMIIGLSNI